MRKRNFRTKKKNKAKYKIRNYIDLNVFPIRRIYFLILSVAARFRKM